MLDKLLTTETLAEMPEAKPTQSRHPWWIWFRGEVSIDPFLVCDTLGITLDTLDKKLCGFRPLRTSDVYKIVNAWVEQGRPVSARHVGQFVLLHGKIGAVKERK